LRTRWSRDSSASRPAPRAPSFRSWRPRCPTVSADGLTYTFKLRSGIKFHDGTTLDARGRQVQLRTLEELPVGDLETHASYAAAVFGGFGDPAAAGTAPIGAVDTSSNLASVDTPDSSTVVIHLRTVQSNFLISQTAAPFGIQSPTAIGANDGNNPKLADNPYALGANGQGKAMVGTGPFMFSEWVPGDHVTLVRTPTTGNSAAAPYLDRIVFKPFANSASKVEALQTGSVDLVESLEPTAVKTVSRRPEPDGSGPAAYLCNITQLAMNDSDIINGLPNLAANQGRPLRDRGRCQPSPPTFAGFYAGEAGVADNWLPAGAQYYKLEYLPTVQRGRVQRLPRRSRHPHDRTGHGPVVSDGRSRRRYARSGRPGPGVAKDLDAAGFKIHLRARPIRPSTGRRGWRQAADVDQEPVVPLGQPGRFPCIRTSVTSRACRRPCLATRTTSFNTAMNAALAGKTEATAKADWQKAQDLIAGDMPTVPLLSSKLPAGARGYVRGLRRVRQPDRGSQHSSG